jgi:hypothetical protein
MMTKNPLIHCLNLGGDYKLSSIRRIKIANEAWTKQNRWKG